MVIPAVCLAAGLLLGAGGVWWLRRDELAWLRAEVKLLTDRLVHAHLVEKAIVPPRPLDPVPVVPLPPILQAEVDQWEDPESKAAVRQRIEALRAQGRKPEAIVLALNEPKGVG